MTEFSPVSVILIEDHSIVREGLKLILRRSPDITVIGETASGRTGVALFKQLVVDAASPGAAPTVVITDIGLPDIGGLEVLRQIRALQPEARVLILTMHTGGEYVHGMLEAGATGYLLKQAAPQELADAIRAVARGENFVSPDAVMQLLRHTERRRGQKRPELSKREREVLQLLARGNTSKGIALELNVGIKTVETHRAKILKKLGVSNSAAAITLAHQHGLLDAPPPRPVTEGHYPEEATH